MWSHNPIVGFDTETTGVDPTEARLVTASVVIVDDERITKHYWLADPGVEIPLNAQNVHGISTEKAQREGRPVREVLSELAELLHHHLQQNHAIVAFNASYDLTLIETELARHGLPTLEERLERPLSPVVDPFILDKTLDRWRKGKRTLELVAQHYGVWDDDSFHNAEADVLVTLRVLGAMLRKFPDTAAWSHEELMRKQSETYIESANYFAKKATERGRPYTQPVGWPIAK
ncbi:exonuclease domain-containing protein [Arcanobacterium bovis]|uniref:DNA polymerase III subunit epsilon n=1 Tax=Arcanobacterium bovis TaxID=2529275 RepID=A0A4Q9V0K2_9ACTO|nr:exonuclease domain-containing protein [Arcanobacterium bovis]TBW22189.1 DNA polymerase III subunit epsilon [Arcanobacterium bovis]